MLRASLLIGGLVLAVAATSYGQVAKKPKVGVATKWSRDVMFHTADHKPIPFTQKDPLPELYDGQWVKVGKKGSVEIRQSNGVVQKFLPGPNWQPILYKDTPAEIQAQTLLKAKADALSKPRPNGPLYPRQRPIPISMVGVVMRSAGNPGPARALSSTGEFLWSGALIKDANGIWGNPALSQAVDAFRTSHRDDTFTLALPTRQVTVKLMNPDQEKTFLDRFGKKGNKVDRLRRAAFLIEAGFDGLAVADLRDLLSTVPGLPIARRVLLKLEE